MLYCPLTRRIRKTHNTILFQGHSLDLDKRFLFSRLHIKIKSGVAVCCLRANCHRFKKQIACTQPFFHDFVWNPGIHIDQTISFSHPDQIPFCLSLRVVTLLHKNLCFGHKKFRAPACILHVDRLLFSCNPGIRNKTVRPFQKCRPLYSLIFHNHLSPVLPGISPSLTFSSCLASSFVR